MPRHRHSPRGVCFNTVLLFSLMVLTGHAVIYFWEQSTLQNDLKIVKHSLHHLKDSVASIEKAYDNLYAEILDLSKFSSDLKLKNTPQKAAPKPPKDQGDVKVFKCKEQCHFKGATLDVKNNPYKNNNEARLTS